MKSRNKLLCVLVIFFALLVLGACSKAADETSAGTSDEGVYTSLSEIEDKRIGVVTGSVQAIQAEERFPNAKFFYFSTTPDTLNALRANKIDAFAEASILVKYMMSENPDLTYMDELIADDMKVCGIFPKTDEGQKLCDDPAVAVCELVLG